MSEIAPPLRAIDRAAIRVVLPILERYATEPLRIRTGAGDQPHSGTAAAAVNGVRPDDIEIGLGNVGGERRGPDFVVRHPAVWRAIARRGVPALGATYADGWWSTTDLEGVIRFFVALVDALPGAPNVDPITRRVRPEAATKQSSAHELGADDPTLLANVLDKTMFTGTGRFGPGDGDLYAASLAQFTHVCDVLDLQPGDRVLEVGTGWGAFAMFAARTRQCEIVSLTPHEVEATFAAKRLDNAGLGNRVDIVVGPLSTRERFTKAVSLNANLWTAGPVCLPDIFAKHLAPDGRALVTTHIAEADAAIGAFGAGPYRPTLAAVTKAFDRHRVATLHELVDDDIASTAERINNLVDSEPSLERAGYSKALFRARHFALARDKVLAERLVIRSVELGIR